MAALLGIVAPFILSGGEVMRPVHSRLNPEELFTFLEAHDSYPVSGQHLAAEARQEGTDPQLSEFFEALPGTLKDESQIVKHAIDPAEAPLGQTLDLGQNEPQPATNAEATLEIHDITKGAA